VIYLLDADTLISADRLYYPLKRFPIFWEWLLHMGAAGSVKVPIEQFEEVTSGKGDLVDWLKVSDTKIALILQEEAAPAIVSEVIFNGYGDLDEHEIEKVGRDPFLISYGYAAKEERYVVTFENSSPSKKGKNRKIPDVCKDLGVNCGTLFDMIEALDFTTNWKPK
jgi:uncharacterized protein DUF4411